MSEVEPIIKPSYIDGALSIQFNECSIAAADACSLAGELLTKEPRVMHVATPEGEVRNDTFVNLLNSTFVAIPEFSDVSFLNNVEFCLEKADLNSVPRLMAVFNWDIAVPLASFARRKNGNCSYVQIGQEMHEDNMIVTSDDRTTVVETIRRLLKGGVLPDTDKTILVSLLQQEIINNFDLLQSMQVPALSRYAFKTFMLDMQKEVADLRILRVEDGSYVEPDVRISYLSRLTPPKAKGFDDPLKHDSKTRNIEYALTELKDHNAEQKRLYLHAVTRGILATPLAMFTSTGELYLLDAMGKTYEPDAETVKMIHAFIVAVNTAEFATDFVNGEIVKYLKNYSDKIINCVNTGDNYSISEFTKSIRSLRREFKDQKQTFTNKLQVSERFDQLLGEYEVDQEFLVQRLGELLVGDAVEYSLVLPKQKVGKTVCDVDILARISKTDRAKLVSIYGRPVPLPDEAHQDLLSEVIYDDRPNSADPDKLKEITSIIAQISLGFAKLIEQTQITEKPKKRFWKRQN